MLNEEKETDEVQITIEPKEEKGELNETEFDEDIQNLDSEDGFEKLTKEQLIELLREEKQKLSQLENKLKYSLADYQNLEKKTKSDIESNVRIKIDRFMISFLQIYDDFIRAKTVLSEEKGKQEGLEFILKNMK